MRTSRILLAVLGFLIVWPASAQQKILWQKRYGGVSDDFACSAVKTSDGGYVVLSSGAFPSVTSFRGERDMMLTKFQASGVKVWEHCYGGSSWEWVDVNNNRHQYLVEAPNGDFIFAAETQSFDGQVSGRQGTPKAYSTDIWVVRTNSQGTLLWQRCIGGTSWERLTTLVSASDTTVLIGGGTTSGDGNLSGIHGTRIGPNNMYPSDAFLTMLDGSGKIMWSRLYGGTGPDVLTGVVPAEPGYFLCTGWTASNDGDFPGRHNGSNPAPTVPTLTDAWIMKVDYTGQKIWSKTIGGSATDEARAIHRISAAPEYLLALESQSRDGDFSSLSIADSSKVKLLRLDKSGNIRWLKTYGNAGWATSHQIVPAPDGTFWLCNSILDAGGDVPTVYGAEDIWLQRINDSGKKLESMIIGGSGVDFFGGFLPGLDGRDFILAGTRSKDGDLAKNQGLGGWDAWVALLDHRRLSVPGTAGTAALRAFPIPALDVLHLQVENSGEGATYRMIDLSGRCVGSGALRQGETDIDVRNLARGRYEVIVTSDITSRRVSIVLE